jgi:uroporphyrinogen-III decarboxylase
MTSRERILATIRGDETDRFPVWLKAGPEMIEASGCDRMAHCGVICKPTRPHVTVTSSKKDNAETVIWSTPDGDLTSEETTDPVTGSSHPSKYPVSNAEELQMFRWYCKDTTYAVDPAVRAEKKTRQDQLEKDDVVTSASIGPSPLMQMIEHLCGPENMTYLMYDEPELFAEVLEEMHQDRLRMLTEALPNQVSDTYWMTENTSTTLISPKMFEDYCVPYLTTYGNMILENEMIPVHHMCGHLNAILEQIDELPAMANEAFTTAPVGNTSLADGRTRMPSKCLIGGTNATLWLDSAENIIDDIEKDLADCPDRRKIFLTSAGVLPPAVTPEKAKTVVDAIKEMPCH